MDVSVSDHNVGEETANGGSASFELDFTTDRALRYRYVARIPGVSLDFGSVLGFGRCARRLRVGPCRTS